MLPVPQRILFLLFAAVALGFGARGFLGMYRRIARGRVDTDARTNDWPRRLGYALRTTLLQSRTFRKRPWVGVFHSFIFYGFVFYLLVNLVDAIDGFVPLPLRSLGPVGQGYVLCADVLSALVLVGVVALVLRRFALPSRRDFGFNERTLLHPDVRLRYVTHDSAMVSAFILFHVGSRAVGAGAKLAMEGPDRFAPFATLLSHLVAPAHALLWREFGYWGALGSVLAFLTYFPYSKHVHLFMAPVKYAVAREGSSGVLPAVELDPESDTPQLGAERLEDLPWPRLVDAYACIQCNRCQDVCPATATGKALSPSALEINKRMELNELARQGAEFADGAPSPRPLLQFALSPEAAWACTTCGACLEVCPVEDEPMLDIVDIRRQQVMLAGQFPAQLQTAFRGMERAGNPWGINHDKRMDWAAGLNVKTTEQNPAPDVLFWVGCAASYDPQAQKTARALVQLLDHAGVDFAVLGKRECCTGDTARRAGNEYLYRQLAEKNVTALNEVKPKLIVATCPHCMNTVGKEYGQLGGDFKVVHHTEYLAGLVAEGRLQAQVSDSSVTYHDPCYLGRHNGVYDAPRNVLHILSNDVVELPRNRENSFCCGAGGAQFWKEEEAGNERISSNRMREVRQALQVATNVTAAAHATPAEPRPESGNVLAVGCPFCKSMLESAPAEGETAPVEIRDVAELLLEGVRRRSPAAFAASRPMAAPAIADRASAPAGELPPPSHPVPPTRSDAESAAPATHAERGCVARKSWVPKRVVTGSESAPSAPEPAANPAMPSPSLQPVPAGEQHAPPLRKAWKPRAVATTSASLEAPEPSRAEASWPNRSEGEGDLPAVGAPLVRKAWKPKAKSTELESPDAQSPNAQNPDAQNPNAQNPDPENPDPENPQPKQCDGAV